MSVCSSETKTILVGILSHQNGWKTADYGSHVKEIDEICDLWRTNIIFLTMNIWDAFNENVNQTRTLSARTEIFESRMSAAQTEKLPGWEKPHAKTVAWSYDMEGHAPRMR